MLIALSPPSSKTSLKLHSNLEPQNKKKKKKTSAVPWSHFYLCNVLLPPYNRSDPVKTAVLFLKWPFLYLIGAPDASQQRA